MKVELKLPVNSRAIVLFNQEVNRDANAERIEILTEVGENGEMCTWLHFNTDDKSPEEVKSGLLSLGVILGQIQSLTVLEKSSKY